MSSNNIKSVFYTILRGLQNELRKIVAFFLTGFLITIFALRSFGWNFFENMMRTNMSEEISSQVSIITQTPFEVFLLQIKIGFFMGIIFTVPILLYIINKNFIPDSKLDTSKVPKYILGAVVLFSFIMISSGLLYSYNVFFPTIFNFLASLTISAGISPTYSISSWTVFIFILSVSFSVAAQIPIVIPILVGYDVVSYQAIRNKWRHWIVFTAIFGAVLSPPEPISQILWALPLIILYVISLGISKIVLKIKSVRGLDSTNKDLDGEINDNNRKSVKREDSEDTDNTEYMLSDINIPELNEDTVGKYKKYLDIAIKGIRSNLFIILGIFMLSTFGSFYLLFGYLTEFSIEVLSSEINSQEMLNIVELHPVEFLLFQVKISFIIGILVTTISAVVLIWPHFVKNKLSDIPRSRLVGYILVISGIFISTMSVTFLYIIPEIINILILDVERINGIVSFRISSLFWSIVYISAIFGFILSLYFSVIFSFYEDVLDYEIIYSKWRHILFGIVLASILVTPSGILKALSISLPIIISFLLALTTVMTLRYKDNIL